MLFNDEVSADELRVYGQLQDAAFLTSGNDKIFVNPSSGSSQVAFNHVTPVPEPCTILLFSLGLICLAGARKKSGI
jgi:hypothetical protein